MGGEGQSKAAASADLRVGKCVVGWGDGKKGTPGHGGCDEHLDRNSSDEKVPSKVVSRGQGSRPGLGTWAGPAPTEAPRSLSEPPCQGLQGRHGEARALPAGGSLTRA